jgi:NADH:ubiquinone oxidoreductase subunit F (NADH-binding)
MSDTRIQEMRRKHKVQAEISYEPVSLRHGYTDRVLRVDIGENTFDIQPVPPQMKELWTGGKGYDLWLMFQEINKNTQWDDPENVICLSSGPLGGVASFPGSGKTLVTTISPATQSIMDSNVGGYFGPYLKFAGFDAMVLTGKAQDDVIIVIDVPKQTITIENAPGEALDAHVICEQLTEMYADNEDDKRNIAVVSAGSAADHVWMGILNFSFYDWRRKVARIKQAGRGGLGTVFRNKKLKALVIKNKFFTPAWSIAEPPFAAEFKIKVPATAKTLGSQDIKDIAAQWNGNREYVTDMLLEAQNRQGFISREIIDGINEVTGIPKAHLYHIVTFYPALSLEPFKNDCCRGDSCSAGIQVLPSTQKTVLKNFGEKDPENIDTAMVKGAYSAFTNAEKNKSPDGILQTIIDSGLRGRGGGGFPAGTKWQAAKQAGIQRKTPPILICNAAESSPTACIDSTIIESDPHAVIEGMLIGGYAVGAREGHVFIRSTYFRAQDNLQKAIDQARSKGMLGDRINGSDFSFDMYIHQSPGSFVDGEASAVIQSLSGKAGEPQAKTAHHSESGFRDAPTVINNVETWVTIPIIVGKGVDWYKSLNSRKGASSGTKVFALSGAVNKAGLAEVPLGISIKELIDTCGEGVPAGRFIKTVMIGGPSGGFLPTTNLDTSLDFESLADAGCVMGTGDIMVFDQTTCMVETIRSYVKYLAGESCGKCTPCREGLQQMYSILQKIGDGKGNESDLEDLKDIAETLAAASLCHFGRTAANPVLTGVRYFREDLMTHIRTGKCPSQSTEVK